MPLISESYRAQNVALHAERANYGITGQMWAPYVDKLVESEGYGSILDYGCGKGQLAANLPHLEIAEYDPAIEGKTAMPQPAELVVCTDVLEHIEPEHLNAVLRHMASLTKRKLFFNIATRPSTKQLDDGRNSHLIVRPAEWWREKLAKHFRIMLWQQHPGGALVYGEATPRLHAVSVPFLRQRRVITKDMALMVEQIRDLNHAHSDAFSRLRTFNFWEGIDDEQADMQIVMNILEHTPDVDEEMSAIVRIAKKAVMVFVALTPEMGEAAWRRLFERYLHVGDWHVQRGLLTMCGAPKVAVHGVTAIGAMESQERWEQLKANSARVTARLIPAAAHTRRAIIACYGPSLGDTMDIMREEIASTGGMVVSVSGSHDFLIGAGIVPGIHVECDPRPHKADNINAGHPDVLYCLGSSVHPKLLDKLEGHDVRLWHISTPEHALPLVDELHESPDIVISGGGSVGLRAITMLYAMGYRDFSIYGMDCSFAFPEVPDEIRAQADALVAEGTPAALQQAKELQLPFVKQWAGKHAGKRQDVFEVVCGDRLFISSPILLAYMSQFFEIIQAVDDMSIRVFGDGLLQATLRGFDGSAKVKTVVWDKDAEQLHQDRI